MLPYSLPDSDGQTTLSDAPRRLATGKQVLDYSLDNLRLVKQVLDCSLDNSRVNKQVLDCSLDNSRVNKQVLDCSLDNSRLVKQTSVLGRAHRLKPNRPLFWVAHIG